MASLFGEGFVPRPGYPARGRCDTALLLNLKLVRQVIMRGGGKILQLFLAHALVHVFRGALQAGFLRIAALDSQGCAGGFLLGF